MVLFDWMLPKGIRPTWTTFTGLEMSPQLLQQTLAAAHPEDLQGVVAKLGTEFQARMPMQTKFRFRHVNGEYRWVLVYANPLFDPDWSEDEKPWVVGRKPFGRIAIANSDAGGEAYTNAAIDQAYRAVEEIGQHG